MFQIGNLNQFITEFGQLMWKEKADNQRWDFWLHRVWDRSFDQYVYDCENQISEPETEDMDNIETIINNSNDILENFSFSE